MDKSSSDGFFTTDKQELLKLLLQKKGLRQGSAKTITRRTDTGSIPFSYFQEQLWLLAQLNPKVPFYNEPATVHIRGQLDAIALEKSLKEITRRHEALRTNFMMVSGQPVQMIAPPPDFKLTRIDLRKLSKSERETEAIRQGTVESQKLFDLTSSGLLMRAILIQLTDQEYRLFLTFHHIAIDGVSLYRVFLKELATLYQAFSSGQRSPLSELPVQYADFAVWQRQWMQGEVLSQQLDYWKQKLSGELPILQFPCDHPRPPVQSFRGAKQKLTLSKSLSEALKALSQQEGVTLFMTVLTAFKTLLYRYTQQEDLIVGTASAGRHSPDIENLIGYFVNMLVLRTDCSGNPSFRQLLDQVRKVLLEAYAHQDIPFQKLVETLHRDRDLSKNALFQVICTMEPPPPAFDLDWTVSLQDVDNATSKFDLFLNLEDRPEGMIGYFEYSTDLFDADRIHRMVGHFQTLLAGIVTNPHISISELPLLTDKEHHQLLVEWNNTQVNYPNNQCIHQLFEEQVEKTPDAVAVVFEGEELTYHELNCQANQLAHYLQTLGVGSEVLVGICVNRTLAMVVGVLGILKAGGAYVAIDPTYPSERISYMLENSQASVLLTQQNLVAGLPEIRAQIICLDADWNRVSQKTDLNPNCTASEENLAYVIYTSGSTGQPKGVAMKHLALSNLILWQRSNTTVSTRAKTLQFAPISFDVSFQEIFSTWCEGGTLVLISEEVQRDPVALLHLLREKQIERLFLPFVALQQLAETAQTLGLIPTRLVEVITAGEQLQITPAIASFFSQLKDCSLHNQYGPSETHVVTAFTLTGSTDNWSALPPIGRPIANTQIYLLDQLAQPVPVGIPGELYIGGVSLARGYLNRPELTEQKFIPNPFSNKPGSRLYKTGDLARYLPDGKIEYLGRIDNQVKVRGFRIEVGEIEVILAQHPDLRQTAVIVREDQPGDKRLVAYVCPNEGQIPTSGQLRRFLSEKLPDYMVPGTFVILEAFPLTPSGKVDRKALPIPDASSLIRETRFVTPRDSVELQLAQIWSEVLGISPIGVHDNLIELGGHSLLATKIIGLVRDRFGVELPLNCLFECPTVAELAKEVLQQEGLTIGAPLQLISRDQTIPLSFAQEQLWFLNQLTPEEPVYNETLSIHLGGDLNIPALEESLTELIRRHEILRTTYSVVNGQPCQEIQPPSAFTLPIVDLRECSETKRETEAVRIATEQLRQGFDLTRGPLLRGTLIQHDPANYRLYFAIHHSVIDAESFVHIIQELEIIYRAFCQGLPSPLPELPIQYADFAVWQRQRLQGEILSNQLAYWQKKLENLPQLKLPTDRPRTPQTTFTGSFVRHRLSFELIEKLQTLSRKENVTLFVTLATAIKVLLYRYSTQEDIVLGTVISQRDRPELEGIIGNFLNALVLRSDLSGNPSFCQLLKRVRNVYLSAYSHQDVPFQKVVEALHPEYQVNQNPMFQVAFTMDPPLVTEDKLGWKAFYFEVDPEISKFDISFYLLEEESEKMVLLTEYNTDLFDAATIKRMNEHLKTLLEGIVSNPNQSIAELPLLTESERHQLLVEWNDTQVDYPKDKCIHQLFEEQVERTPDAVAVVFEEQELTYHELNCQANQLAYYLQTLGVGPEVLVGICVERSLAMIVGLLGILKAGGAYVPLDPNYPTERIAYMLEDSAVPVLLTQSKLRDRLPETQVMVVLFDADWNAINSKPQQNPVHQTKSNNLAYVMYTSGSTGKPKGVMVAHQGLCNLAFAHNRLFDVEQNSRILQFASFSFDASIWEIVMSICSGARLFMGTTESLRPGAELIELLQKQAITHVTLSPSAFFTLSNQTLPTLENIIVAGEACTKELVEQWSVGRRFFNAYGPTESTVCATVAECTNINHKPPIGRPIANTVIYILDKHLQPVPIGVPGELHIGGAGLARGYLNRRELTEQKFIPNPFSNKPGSRLYKTGDLARYLPDGNIEFLGRIDNQVKIRGFRIELGEIEAVLAQHSKVREAVVIARSDIPGDKRLVAYLITNDAKTTINDLRSFLKTKLPEYMIPAAFVFLESMPLTPNGKVNRRALPIPDASSLLRESSFIAPRDSVELQLAQIWSEILGVSPIGVRDNFFDLGGHSLLAVRLMAEIEKQFGQNLSLAALFQGATIEQLAILLRQNTDSQSWSPLVAIQPLGNHPPFFCMPGSGGNVVYFHQLARHLGNDQPFYALQPPSLDGISEPFGRVEEVAAYYLQAIQSLQPSGPYFLGGHSFGVLVAFEMAQQLQQLGETVALLALFDLPAPLLGSTPKQLDWDDAQWLTNIAHILEMLSGKNLGISYETLKPLTPEAQLDHLKQQMETVNLLPYNSRIERVRGIVQTIKADELAFMSYLPQAGYEGPITLFRTSEVYRDELGMLGEIPTDSTWGWNQYSSQPVKVDVVPGNHTTMLSEPYVQVLAELLKLCYQQSSPDFQL